MVSYERIYAMDFNIHVHRVLMIRSTEVSWDVTGTPSVNNIKMRNLATARSIQAQQRILYILRRLPDDGSRS